MLRNYLVFSWVVACFHYCAAKFPAEHWAYLGLSSLGLKKNKKQTFILTIHILSFHYCNLYSYSWLQCPFWAGNSLLWFSGASSSPATDLDPGIWLKLPSALIVPHGGFEQPFPPWGPFWRESLEVQALHEAQNQYFDCVVLSHGVGLQGIHFCSMPYQGQELQRTVD